MKKEKGKMVEISIPCCSSNRWIANGKLNPNRIASYWVRAKTKKRCIEILQEKVRAYYSLNALNRYGSLWGTFINRPDFEGEGVWISRDHCSKDLIEVWTDKDSQPIDKQP